MKDTKNKPFQSTIREPRWQQVISVILVLLIAAAYIFVISKQLSRDK